MSDQDQENQLEEMSEEIVQFYDELNLLIDKYEEKIDITDVHACLQSLLFSMVLESAPSFEAAGEFMHTSIDAFLEDLENSGEVVEDSEASV